MATDDLFEEYEEIIDAAVDVLRSDPGTEYTARQLLDDVDAEIETEAYPLYEDVLEDRLTAEIDEGEYESLTYRETRFPGLTTLYFQDELPETEAADGSGDGLLPTLDLASPGRYDAA